MRILSGTVGVPSKHDPIDCLSDIIENIERIREYTSGLDRAAFASSGMVRDAVERCLERVCEAAHRLGERGPELMPDQPWGDIRGMGNWLRHAYDRVSMDVIWNAVRDDLPNLASQAQAAAVRLQKDI